MTDETESPGTPVPADKPGAARAVKPGPVEAAASVPASVVPPTSLDVAVPTDGTQETKSAGSPRRRRLMVILAAAAVLVVNAVLVWLILGWRTDVADARAEAETHGADIGLLRAEESTLLAQQTLLTEQAAASEEWATSLTDDSVDLIANADEIRALAANLDACASDWGQYVAQLYHASASSLAGTLNELHSRCNPQLDELDRLFPGGVLP